MIVPAQPKIYHIVHMDRLEAIIASGGLLSDAQIVSYNATGTTIGMNSIKQRRLQELTLDNYPDLHVGECVPFYFCPRSIMLYLIHQANHPELAYRGGQAKILHLQADLYASVEWARQHQRRWVFTLSNAGSYYFEDRCDLAQLDELDWQAIQTKQWQSCKEGKQAEFLMELSFPWQLVECIGVYSHSTYQQVMNILQEANHRPTTTIKPEWYY
ncbi:type II toxin-antitoxin system toxin DNA ADP-ribosyl transferase DarT [Methylomarinum vadi]|uniref:type II toxin-antitoxin system toxin DNA ADP-ribosyl transferase DarT n=1 Tax=Methylomarinum vadi TaxID=438855 RepID=UPI0004DF61BD|nr:DUF4433 domain-containing protein [Methylomarinum vadi]